MDPDAKQPHPEAVEPLQVAPSPPAGPRRIGPTPRQHVMERTSISGGGGGSAEAQPFCFGGVDFGQVLGTGIQRSGIGKRPKNEAKGVRKPPAGALLHLCDEPPVGPLNLIHEAS